MTEFISPDKDGRAPEQRIIDPLTGRNITGEYASGKRGELEAGLKEVFLEIARKAFNRETDIIRSVIEKALEYHKEYFQVMKGGTNLRAEDIKDAVAEEVERQNRFYNFLAGLEVEFKRADIRFEILSPDRCYEDSYWDTGLVSECNIRVGSAYLCAFPLVPARTSCYMALVQAPVAAGIIFVNEDCVLLMPQNQDFGDDFIKRGEGLFSRRTEVKEDFPGASIAYLGNNFLSVETDEVFSRRRLSSLKKKYRVSAIIKGGPAFTGCIFTGREEKLSALLKEFDFN